MQAQHGLTQSLAGYCFWGTIMELGERRASVSARLGLGRRDKSIMQYLVWYNRSRPPSKLGKKTPEEASAVMLPAVKQAA